MKKSLLIGALTLGIIGLTGCAAVPSQVGYALIVAESEPITATEVAPRKRGSACGFNLLGIFAGGDMSIEKAKRNGGISRVASVDKDVKSILFLFSSVCTTVTGE